MTVFRPPKVDARPQLISGLLSDAKDAEEVFGDVFTQPGMNGM